MHINIINFPNKKKEMFAKHLLFLAIIIAVVPTENEGYENGYRQCSCAEQTECFEGIKSKTAQCFEQETGKLGNALTKNLADPTKTKPCFDKFNVYVKDWLSCVDAKLVKESSCLATKSDINVQSDDFLTTYAKIMEENVDKRMNYLYGLAKHPLIQLDKNWHESAKQCAFEQVAEMNCFKKYNCVLKASEKEVQKVVKQCYKEFDVVKVQHNRCECMAKNVPGYGNGLQSYCDKVKVTVIPEE